ncbi:RNA-guided endonuclease InsQ/TnpB family protein [Microseira wollei]|uniref:IS605 family transposase OrfB n=1 Tax=Microseira wollei NIES-4236 TaxID=2530354 RepID=A0AAV3XRI3_9CYAN|nr:transposase [Microseira wollei]GET43222.1 IS605 family transposase OrfB [Microseira wollei NIES-4236]
MYSLKLELKLNNFERSLLAGCAGFSRFVYNFGLSLLTQSWAFEEIKATDSKRLAEIEKVFTNHVKTKPEYAWMKQYPSAIYSSALRNLAKALERWRKGSSGFPGKKSKKRGESFTVLKKSGVYRAKGEKMIPFTNRQTLYPGKKIAIPGLGEFRLKQRIPFICSSQTFTISRVADKWFVSFTLDVDKVPTLLHSVQSVGIDLGVKNFATLSDNSKIVAPQSLKDAKAKLSREQWRNRNKRLGNRNQGIKASNNALKYYRRLARGYARLANIRRDFWQKTTTDISRKYYLIRIEDLNVAGMIANGKLAEAISSLGFYEFRRMLLYKSAFFGTKVELVDRWFPSSKTCSCCGNVLLPCLFKSVFTFAVSVAFPLICRPHAQGTRSKCCDKSGKCPKHPCTCGKRGIYACGQEGADSLG